MHEKGIENLEVPHNSFGGLITLWIDEHNLLLVNLANMSPMFTTICSGRAVTEIHSFFI